MDIIIHKCDSPKHDGIAVTELKRPPLKRARTHDQFPTAHQLNDKLLTKRIAFQANIPKESLLNIPKPLTLKRALSDITNRQSIPLSLEEAPPLKRVKSGDTIPLPSIPELRRKPLPQCTLSTAFDNFASVSSKNNALAKEQALQTVLDIVETIEDKNFQDENGNTILHIACKLNMPELVKYLIKSDADLNKADFTKKTPLMYALRYESIECARLLLQSQTTNINAKDRDGYSFLYYLVHESQNLQHLQNHVDFSKVSIETFFEMDNKKTPLFLHFMRNRALIQPTILQLSTMWHKPFIQGLITNEFTNLIKDIDTTPYLSNLQSLSRDLDDDSHEVISFFKLAIEAEKRASKNQELPEGISPNIDRIIDDIDNEDLTSLRNFISITPLEDYEISDLVNMLERSLTIQQVPLSSAWQVVQDILKFYTPLSKQTSDNLSLSQLLQTALYITDNIIKNEDYVNKFSIIEKNADLPVKLAIFIDGNISILTYDIQEIERELREEGTSISLTDAINSIKNQEELNCLLFELGNLKKSNLPGAWKFLRQIYNKLSVVVTRKDKNLKNLGDAIRFIERCNSMQPPTEMTSKNILFLLDIQLYAEAVVIFGINGVKQLLLATTSLPQTQFTIFISEFKEHLANQIEPLSKPWKFIRDTFKQLDDAAGIADYQKLMQSMPNSTIYVLDEIAEGLDNDSFTAYTTALSSKPPLTQNEIAYLMSELEKLSEQRDSNSWKIIQEIIQNYKKSLNTQEPANQQRLKEYLSDIYVDLACNSICSDIDNVGLRDAIVKLKESINFEQFKFGKYEADRLINNLSKMLGNSPNASLIKKICQRFMQISTVKIEKRKGITPHEYFLLSSFIEYDIGIMSININTTFNEKIHDLPRKIHFDQNGIITIWAHHKVSIVSGEGSYKKVLSAIKVPFNDINENAERVVVAYAKRADAVEIMQYEAKILQKLQDIKGIMRLHSIINFNDAGDMNLGFMLPEYGCNLKELYSTNKPTFLTQLSFARQLVSSVNNMHSRGIIHWDLKLENMLSKGNDIFLIDFGMAFEPGVKDLDCPWYGSPRYSATELVYKGKYKFNRYDIEDCKRAEVMSLGFILYKLHFDKDFTYPKDIFLEDYSDEAVDAPLRELLAKEGKDLEDDYKILIYKMLKSNPQDRISLDDALVELSNPKFGE